MDGSGDSCQNETRYCEQFLRVACYVPLSGFVRVDLWDAHQIRLILGEAEGGGLPQAALGRNRFETAQE